MRAIPPDISRPDRAFVEGVLLRERGMVEQACSRRFDRWGRKGLRGAGRYTVLAGGKRLRPVLMVRVYRALGGTGRSIYDLSLSLEIIHSYSLIHDDLPQMDDDEFRRGKPTCHVKFGMPIALLAGVSLIGEAVGSLVRAGRQARCSPSTLRELIRELTAASGPGGLVAGQAADIVFETREFEERDLEFIHRNKTAALFGAAAAMGAISAGATAEKVGPVRDYGLRLGIAFQIIDDILDEIGTFEKLGKNVRKDEVRGKATYPSLLGVEGARERAVLSAGMAVDLLAAAGIDDRFLRLFPHWILLPGFER
jgi:geranylgeranyl diphosphate synthase type II